MVRLDPFIADVSSEPISNLLWNVYDLLFLATFGISEEQFPLLYIVRSELQNLADSHTPSGHELQDEAVPWLGCSEYDLVDDVFFKDVPVGSRRHPEQLSQHWAVTGILKILIQVVLDEVEKRPEVGIPSSLG